MPLRGSADNRNPRPQIRYVCRHSQGPRSRIGVITMKALAGGTSRVRAATAFMAANPEALGGNWVRRGVPGPLRSSGYCAPSVDTAIICMTDHDQLEENVQAMSESWTDRG